MKKLATICAILGMAFSLQAQKQTFLLPAYFATNVFLHDNTNTPLSTRIQAAEATNAAGWSGYPATTNVNLGSLLATNVGGIQYATNVVTTTWTNEGNVYWDNSIDTLAIVTSAKNPDGTPVIDEVDFNSYVWVKNASGATISNTCIVAIIPDSGGVLTVIPASYPTNTKTIGVATYDIAVGAEARVNYFGSIGNAATYGLQEGAEIYLNTGVVAGINWTTNKTGGAKIGYVTRAASSPTAGNGTILVEISNGTQATNVNAAILTNLSAIVGSGLTVQTNKIVGPSLIALSNRAETAASWSNFVDYTTEAAQRVIVFYNESGNDFQFWPFGPSFMGSTGNVIRYYADATNLASGKPIWGPGRVSDIIREQGNFTTTNITLLGSLNSPIITNVQRIVLEDSSPSDYETSITTYDGSLFYSYTGVTQQFAWVAGTVEDANKLGGIAASSYLTLSAFQSTVTNYARFLTTTAPPATPTNSGSHGELRVDATNLYMYIGASNRWMRIPGSMTW